MKRADLAALVEFYDEEGRLFGRTLAAEWIPPDSVELAGGELMIRSRRHDSTQKNPRQPIRAPPQELLDRFIALGDASDERNTLRFAVKSTTPSDEKICSFAARYGGLQIFYTLGGDTHWPLIEHFEHCDVWRYFARVMRSLQRIASDQYQGGCGSKEDWLLIHRVPSVMRTTARASSPGLLHSSPFGDEEHWLALAHFIAKPSQQNRRMFGHLINTLLGLGCIRPWLTWPDAARKVVRPQITYSSRRLLSQLALQLCLRLAKIDAMLVCTACQHPYSPLVRAPKAGLRHFCPECRAKGIPERYALRDFRKRQRQSRKESEGP
jgi:hypothetical protein